MNVLSRVIQNIISSVLRFFLKKGIKTIQLNHVIANSMHVQNHHVQCISS
jgi:hypothetical protein